ncbi:trigger factor-related chaperone [Mycoplasmopsis gallopavonis]|uniref:Trigger factor n=1 Tax=Mycoplasmopsis gallopavonis TaxID=76629 RepID=A0A449AZN6_9BACT|nr:hypothetical protein [Mycoplasmopsis gallopavonis]RIV16695.1 hypothetical protein D1113_01300 [Mycoplasmopsis gallopavonis]VEU72945.1 Uncharacterised protein [Mycoplasmopsis gallopavonis]
MLKHDIIQFKLEGEEWIKAQNDALNYLNKKHEKDLSKVNQKLILELAQNAYIEMKINEVFTKDFFKDNIISLMPISQNIKATIETLEFELKKYYFDDFSKISFELKNKPKFQVDSDYQEKIQQFQTDFLKSYEFLLDVDRAIQDNDFVQLKIKIKNKDLEQDRTIQVIANQKATTEVEKAIIGLKKGDKTEITKDETKLFIEVDQIKEKKVMPITEENIHLLNLPEIKSLNDVQNQIAKSVTAEIFSDALFKYSQEVWQDLFKNNPQLEIPTELLNFELNKNVQNPEEFAKFQEQAKEMITQFFWVMLVQKALKLRPTEEEIQKETKLVQSFLNEPDPNKIDRGRINYILTSKKLGLYYLNQDNKELAADVEAKIQF